MKKIFCLILSTIFIWCITDSQVVLASELNEEIYIETTGNDDFDSAINVIKTETVTNISGEGIMLLNDYITKDFSKTMYLNTYTDDGFRLTLCAIQLNGTAHFYDDGKVHLYSLGSSTYIYVDDVTLSLGPPVINNTNGDSSEGIVTFIMTAPEYGLYTYKSWVKLVKNSTAISSGLDLITYLEP